MSDDKNTTNTSAEGIKKRSRSEIIIKEEINSKKKKENEKEVDSNLSYENEIYNATAILSDGIPRRELKLIISEANECEDALERELKVLREAFRIEQQNCKTDCIVPIDKSTDKNTASTNTVENITSDSASKSPITTSVKVMLESEITPLDGFWTLSALLGRLRHELTTPLPPGSKLPAYRAKAGLQQLVNSVGLSYSFKKKRTISTNTPATTQVSASVIADSTVVDDQSIGRSTPNNIDEKIKDVSQFRRLALLPDDPEFFREHTTTDKLLALYKKLNNHRSSLVFRRPVNPKEAPGYSDRIKFPIDLSLIRKLIVSRSIKSYRDILQRVYLIGHNCVKYNGRESDYALVTREFEAVATEYIFTAISAIHFTTNALNNPETIDKVEQKDDTQKEKI